jgi:hypothetical protein
VAKIACDALSVREFANAVLFFKFRFSGFHISLDKLSPYPGRMKAPQVLYLAHQLIWIDQFNPSRNLRLSRVMTYQTPAAPAAPPATAPTTLFLAFVAVTNANPQPTAIPILAPLIIDERTSSWLKSLKTSA